jgi:hypothetical protein
MGKYAFQLRLVLGLMACTVLAFGVPVFSSDFSETPPEWPVSNVLGMTAGQQFGPWTVGGPATGQAVIDRVRAPYWQGSPAGDATVDLAGVVSGSITASISGLTSGAYYNVNFWLAGNPEGGPALKTAAVTFGGSQQTVDFDITGLSNGNMGWVYHSLLFMADSDTLFLQFADATVLNGAGPGYGAVVGGLATVTAAAIPEPATMALMGGALLGLALIRRRRAVR